MNLLSVEKWFDYILLRNTVLKVMLLWRNYAVKRETDEEDEENETVWWGIGEAAEQKAVQEARQSQFQEEHSRHSNRQAPAIWDQSQSRLLEAHERHAEELAAAGRCENAVVSSFANSRSRREPSLEYSPNRVSSTRSRVSKHITPFVNSSFRNLDRIFPEPLGKSTVHAAAHIQYISRPQQQLWPPISQLQNKSPTLLSAMILSPYASAAGVIPRLSDNTRNEPTQKLCAAAGNKTNQSGS